MDKDTLIEVLDELYQSLPEGGDPRKALNIAIEVITPIPDYEVDHAVEVLAKLKVLGT